MATQAKKPGKKPLTEAEKAARKTKLQNESKAERFVRVAAPRVKKAIKALSAVAACTGSRYEYTDEQRDKILTAIGSAATNLRNALMNERATDTGFTL